MVTFSRRADNVSGDSSKIASVAEYMFFFFIFNFLISSESLVAATLTFSNRFGETVSARRTHETYAAVQLSEMADSEIT